MQTIRSEKSAAISEQWRSIPGFEDRYLISNLGNVKSLPNSVRNSELALKPTVHKTGYLIVNLTKAKPDGGWVQKNFWLHRLVLEAWVGECPENMLACHNDGNPRNCRLSNLRWDSYSNNQKDREKHGTSNHGEKNGMAVLTEEQVKEIKSLLSQQVPQNKIAKIFRVSRSAIAHISQGRRWK